MLKIVATLCVLSVMGGHAVPQGTTSTDAAAAAALLRNPLSLTASNQGRYLNHYSDPSSSYLRALAATNGASNYLTRPDDLYSRERELLLRQSYNRFGQYPAASYNNYHTSNYPYNTGTGYPYHSNNNYNHYGQNPYGQNPYNQNRQLSGYNYNKNAALGYDSLNNGLYDSRYYL